MTQPNQQTMDFFEHQDRAKANSRKFFILYLLSIILICLAVATLAALLAIQIADTPPNQQLATALFTGVTAAIITALLITGGAAYRISELKDGGSAVARSLGGQQIDPSTTDPQQRQLLNIVEEMAIASGVPVPPVYLMPGEKGINAFAAGYAPGDAVIGVTKGCIVGLKRDELQGVIAHEFSHILNGDMKLNIKMIGFLNGILLITLIGKILFESTPHITRNSRSKEALGVMVAMGILAAILMILGSIGALAARILQASVSRQREYLADASAVQFTRNPEGIANALRRIGHRAKRTRIRHPRAQELSHMYFANATTTLLTSTLSTHPPIHNRIERINPAWDGTMLQPIIDLVPKYDQSEVVMPVLNALKDPHLSQSDITATALLPLLALTGTMTPAHIDHARTLINSIPKPLKEAAHDISSSRAVVYALLLDRQDANIHQEQINHLAQHADPNIATLTESLSTPASTLDPQLRLPLLDMTLAALAHLSDHQHQTFRANIKALTEMDNTIDLFEWATLNILTRHLDQRFGLTAPQTTQYYALGKLTDELSILLSTLAHAGAQEKQDAITAFDLGHNSLNNPGARLLPKNETNLATNLAKLDAALRTLATCSWKLKRDLLKSCALITAADHTITTQEAELLRAIADALAVPTPPLLPNQKLL